MVVAVLGATSLRLVKISLRFGTAGWYCVTKGKPEIRFFVLFRWRRACVLS